MTDCFIGEVRAFPYTNYVPYGWLVCDGTLYPVQNYQALASLIGNRFGGTWPRDFAVPDLRQCVAVGVGQSVGNGPQQDFHLGVKVGQDQVSLSSVPTHTHALQKKAVQGGIAAKTSKPDSHSNFGQLTAGANTTYQATYTGAAKTGLAPAMLTPAGAFPAEAHENRQPFLAMYYAIAWDGEYPVAGD